MSNWTHKIPLDTPVAELVQLPGMTANIAQALLVTRQKLAHYKRPICSLSGGADSDTMLDIVARCDPQKKTSFFFFDTGMEYDATKRHLDELEERYSIKIDRMRPDNYVAAEVRANGVPFFSKELSKRLRYAQAHGFDFTSARSYEEAMAEYPGLKDVLQWWYDKKASRKRCISYTVGLRDFLESYPPPFKISSTCCDKAKKGPAHKIAKTMDADVELVGVRRAEGGIRLAAYKNCFTPDKDGGCGHYRPIFWLTDADKAAYKELFGLRYSDCYEVWGLTRTGCAGCPFNSRVLQELEIVSQYEPKMYQLCTNIFGPAYEYRAKYNAFKEALKKGADPAQITIEELAANA